MTGGLLLMAAALILTGYNIWDGQRAAKASEEVLEEFPPILRDRAEEPRAQIPTGPDVEIPDYILNPDMEMPVIEIDGNEYIGILEIPSLGLELPIMGQISYDKLKISPCRYSGSAYKGNLVIAGHNYRRHFSSLKTLPADETVIFTDVDGNCFYYKTVENQVLEPSQIQEMITGDWDLTLFTCTYGGQARFALRCEEIDF